MVTVGPAEAEAVPPRRLGATPPPISCWNWSELAALTGTVAARLDVDEVVSLRPVAGMEPGNNTEYCTGVVINS